MRNIDVNMTLVKIICELNSNHFNCTDGMSYEFVMV